MPDPAKCCGECGWWEKPRSAVWPYGECLAPDPIVPTCMSLDRVEVAFNNGTSCPCFKPKEVKDEEV